MACEDPPPGGWQERLPENVRRTTKLWLSAQPPGCWSSAKARARIRSVFVQLGQEEGLYVTAFMPAVLRQRVLRDLGVEKRERRWIETEIRRVHNQFIAFVAGVRAPKFRPLKLCADTPAAEAPVAGVPAAGVPVAGVPVAGVPTMGAPGEVECVPDTPRFTPRVPARPARRAAGRRRPPP